MHEQERKGITFTCLSRAISERSANGAVSPCIRNSVVLGQVTTEVSYSQIFWAPDKLDRCDETLTLLMKLLCKYSLKQGISNQVRANSCKEITLEITRVIYEWVTCWLHRPEISWLMIQMFQTLFSCKRVLFSYECTLNSSNQPRNVAFWGNENPYFSIYSKQSSTFSWLHL
jgi:hypothetical protein